MRVVTVIGTRPEMIRLSRIMATLDRYVDQKVVHTGQNYDYELNQIFFDDLSLRKPDYFLNAASLSASKTVAAIIDKVDDVLAEEKPDAALILGDSNSCLAAYPAKRRKIPIFHVDAGNRSFDQRVPEEINRRISIRSPTSTCLAARSLATIFCAKVFRPTESLKSAVRCSKFFRIIATR